MKEPDLKKIRKAMEKELDPKRYEHTLGVAYTAASLAMCYGADLNSALIAGMLHDCAKCLSNEKKISICKKHDLPINPAEEKNPFLLHAKVGSYLASKKYGVTDPDILNAILNHTTGRPDMSLLEKIVWLSFGKFEVARFCIISSPAESRLQIFRKSEGSLLKILTKHSSWPWRTP